MNTDHRGLGEPTHPAFSLVELLVVVAIITLLLGVLLPGLQRARQVAVSTQCLSRLRQMGQMATLYTTDHRGTFPLAYYWTDTESVSWDFRIDFSNGTGDPRIEPGLLWRGIDGGEVQQAPAYDGPTNTHGDPHSGYNYNTSYLGGYRDFGATEFVPSARIDQVRRPSATAMFGDGQFADGANKYMRAPVANPHDAGFTGRHAGTQGYRHFGRTNIAWVDGHADGVDERHVQTDGQTDPAKIADGTGFLSQDNALYDLN